MAFDLPTPMGYDADHALSEGEVGKCGAAISSSAPLHLARGVVTLRRRKSWARNGLRARQFLQCDKSPLARMM